MENKTPLQSGYENEVTLKEMILTVYKHRKLILIITMICAILSLGYSFFIAKPTYQTSSEVLVNAPTVIDTLYGEYEFQTENMSDYIKHIQSNEVLERVRKQLGLQLTLLELSDKISITTEKGSSRFVLSTVSDSASGAKLMNDTLVEQLDSTLRVAMKKHALMYFIGKYEVQKTTLTDQINQKEVVLSKTIDLMNSLKPVYTLQKALFNDPQTAAVYAKQFGLNLENLSESVMVEEFVNDNYFTVEEQVTLLHLDLIKLRQELDHATLYLADLNKEMEMLSIKYGTQDEQQIFNNILDVYAAQIQIISHASTPEYPVASSKALNLLIGIVLGLMIGIFAVFMKAYWERA